MKFISLIIFVSIFAGCSSVKEKQELKNCEHTDSIFRCVQYVKNYDGDTITFNINGLHPIVGRNISIRVHGIDAPEIKGKAPCEKQRAMEAKELVENLLKNSKKVDLENIQRGKYFRLVADVYVDGISVGRKLLESGLAYPYDGGKKLKKISWCNMGKG